MVKFLVIPVKQNVHTQEKHAHALMEYLRLFYHDFCPFLVYSFWTSKNALIWALDFNL